MITSRAGLDLDERLFQHCVVPAESTSIFDFSWRIVELSMHPLDLPFFHDPNP